MTIIIKCRNLLHKKNKKWAYIIYFQNILRKISRYVSCAINFFLQKKSTQATAKKKGKKKKEKTKWTKTMKLIKKSPTQSNTFP